ncbi:WD40 repeat domain-containing protein [Streptomyces sp. NBC_00582]|uniref:WD40 repeat domain-containing protein n=1 Tax=Streptomyces sp. NBC_00582 TaxID=2975783 RepID=UPI002E821765|nr:WD40 repeat domain-containing protein [Streptomyces sp. NBC_00582]WUB65553.1 WD40 repeat domain-containing protein [Streptomyces sp. NBC_00582]
MNVEELVRDCLREQAEEQSPAAPGLVDRVMTLRRRRRTRRIAAVAAATAAVVAVAVAVPLLDSPKDDVRPASVLDEDGVHAHPDQSPPRDLTGAGDAVLAAYYTTGIQVRTDQHAVAARTYWLLDPGTGRYEKDTRWSFVAVAPGLRTAAVLERSLPARRIGLLDLATGEVERWIEVERGVGGLAFSHDGGRLVATTYGDHPDLRIKEKVRTPDGREYWTWGAGAGQSSRSGFYDLDVASGEGSWSAVAADRDINSRQDFAFAGVDDRVYAQIVGGEDGLQQFYDLDGRKAAAPANERYLRSDVPARLSPSGRLAALGLAKEVGGDPGRSYSSIRDPRTGKEITEVRGAQLLAWVDDRHLIAWERVTSLKEEYRPRLVLVTIGSDRVVPLSGVREQGVKADREGWEPVFARR